MLKIIATFIVSLLLLATSVFGAVDRKCIGNETLREYYVFTVNGANVNSTQDLHCVFGCDSTISQCNGGNILNVWILGIIIVVAAYLMFGRKDAILNIIGSLFIALVGTYMIVSGVMIGFTNTQAETYLVKDYFTNALGILFICVAIYKIAMAWIHMKDASG